ncbi:MAG: hypothetical protein EXR75_01345 [Myxococcales bacterium]|nr:hypothetical protein [Myxococcales bacterium]
MTTWRDELEEAIKSKNERDLEENDRKKKRLEEALKIAKEALGMAIAGMRFASEKLTDKAQPCAFSESASAAELSLHGQSLRVAVEAGDALLRVTFGETRPRDFDFGKDRHIAPRDVEEYIGRRTVEFARAAQKSNPW